MRVSQLYTVVFTLWVVMAACTSAPPPPCCGPSPQPPVNDGVDEPPPGRYGCLLFTLGAGNAPTYIPSTLGTIELGPGYTYRALSYPGDGQYSFDPGQRWVTFQGGALAGVNAAFDRLDDGTPILRFGEALQNPAAEVRIGESVCQGGS